MPRHRESRRRPDPTPALGGVLAIWRQNRLVTVSTRPLNYRNPKEPKEKGIDVLIAIDLVDVGILCSADTDLVPALEAVVRLKGESARETAGWSSYA